MGIQQSKKKKKKQIGSCLKNVKFAFFNNGLAALKRFPYFELVIQQKYSTKFSCPLIAWKFFFLLVRQSVYLAFWRKSLYTRDLWIASRTINTRKLIAELCVIFHFMNLFKNTSSPIRFSFIWRIHYKCEGGWGGCRGFVRNKRHYRPKSKKKIAFFG